MQHKDSSSDTEATRPPLPLTWPERQVDRYQRYPAPLRQLLDGGWEARGRAKSYADAEPIWGSWLIQDSESRL